jgi:hypothetical protein
MKQKIFPFLIAFSALSVSASAAFYSISGLSKLFAGASLQVIIMASSLEVAKLVIASLLYQYWNSINKALRTYLVTAAIVLVLITSMGIYGYLSSAYQATSNKEGIVTQQITALETKKKLYEQTRDNLIKEKQSLADLKGTLSKGSVTQFTDKKGNLVVKSNNANVKQIESANKTEEKLTTKLDIVNDSIFALENKILETKTFSESTSELGPLKYLSNLLGISMDRIVNWLLLIIIFVFDPLAISLVVAANFAFTQLRSKNEYPIEEKVENEIKDWDTTLNDGLEDDFYGDKENKFFNPLDLNNDGIIETEEFNKVFDQIDTNDNGIIDENEAKLSKLSPEIIQKLNTLNASINNINTLGSNLGSSNFDEFKSKQANINEELNNIKNSIIDIALNSKKKDNDNTITYF